MTDTRVISYRIEEDTYVTIEEEALRALPDYHSVRQFTIEAITEYVDELLELGQGGSLLRRLARRLSDVEGLNEAVPECDPTARWGSSEARKQVNPELGPDTLDTMDSLDTNVGLSNTQIGRICTFRKLFELTRFDYPPFRYDWKTKHIQLVWIDIENSFWMQRGAFYDMLHRRFSLMPEKTMELLRGDLSHFRQFAEIYRDEFYGDKVYRKLTTHYPQRAFTDAENVIEELTAESFREEPDFLQDVLQDIRQGKEKTEG